MNKERLYTVLVEPHITEKATNLGASSNQYAFKVVPDATKREIKAAVEELFSVTVHAERQGQGQAQLPGRDLAPEELEKSLRPARRGLEHRLRGGTLAVLCHSKKHGDLTAREMRPTVKPNRGNRD